MTYYEFLSWIVIQYGHLDGWPDMMEEMMEEIDAIVFGEEAETPR